MNVAIKFLEYLNSRSLEAPSKSVEELYNLYKYSSVFIPPSSITVTEDTVTSVYRFKETKFIDLVKYLDTITIQQEDIDRINEFLQSCSKLEVKAFTKILTTPKKIFAHFLPIPSIDPGQCIVQVVPKNTTRLIVKVFKGDVKVLKGTPSKEQLVSLQTNFIQYTGILYFFIDAELIYWYDFKSNLLTTKRMIYLSSQRESKILKILTPYFFNNFVEALRYYYTSEIILKPLKGTFKDIYIFKGM
jgi:hypothetical protein